MQMLILTYVTLGSAMSRLSRVESPASQLRFGPLLLRPNRSVSATVSSLRSQADALCGAMARGVLTVQLGARRLDQNELRELLSTGLIAEKVVERPAIKLPGMPEIPEVKAEETAPPPENPPAADPAPEAALAAEEATPPAEEPAPADPQPTTSGSKKKRGG